MTEPAQDTPSPAKRKTIATKDPVTKLKKRIARLDDLLKVEQEAYRRNLAEWSSQCAELQEQVRNANLATREAGRLHGEAVAKLLTEVSKYRRWARQLSSYLWNEMGRHGP